MEVPLTSADDPDRVTILADEQIADTVPVTIVSPGLLNLASNVSETIGPLILIDGTVVPSPGTGTLTLAGDVSVSGFGSLGGRLALVPGSRTFTVADEGLLSLTGALGGPGGLTKEGLGDLRLSGTFSNTFGGPIVVHDGQLILAKSSGLVAVPGPLIIGNGVSNGMVRLANANQIADGAAVTIDTLGRIGFEQPRGDFC